MKSILEDHVASVYRFVRRLTRDPHAAEDLTQETFLRAWRRRDRLRDPQAACVWLLTIASNVWRDQVRQRGLSVACPGPLPTDVSGPARQPDQRTADHEELKKALAALDRLPPRQREVLYLSACAGLALADIARILGISAAAAKASMSLARKTLREQLPDIDPAPERLP